MVHVGGCGYHLPPCATVTLISIDDKFRAYGKNIRRRVRPPAHVSPMPRACACIHRLATRARKELLEWHLIRGMAERDRAQP